MKYLLILFSGFILSGCVASNPKDTSSSQGLYATSFMGVTKSFVANSNITALDTQLQSDYTGSQVQVLKVGNEVKVTYSSDVLFGVGGEELLPSSQATLDPLINAVKVYPQATVRIDSFTDKSGSPEKNVAHAAERAQSVARYLVSAGLGADKMSLKGYGSDFPVASNDTSEGRAQNRRVVITIKVPAPAPTPAPQPEE